MTVRARGVREARRVAREVTKRWGIKRAEDIRIEAIARAEGLRIVEGPLRGARGRLSSGPQPLIRIAENTINEGARRFTIAHELGHHLLKHPAHGSEGACASARADGPPNPRERDYEAEANAFASELLLPRHLVAPKCDGDPSLEIPRSIAFEFLMSVPASSIRYVQLTRARCAAIYSERGSIEWAPKSHGFKTRFARGRALPTGSMALECARNANVHDEARTIAANVWFDTKERVDIIEHSAPVSEAGGVITLLWVPDSVADRIWPRAA
jgi:Zn-dependent peptidase ImmA (M78 family)